jgi:hypothetical protein
MFKQVARPLGGVLEIPDDQREWIRYPCAGDATCRILVGPVIAYEAVRLENVSEAGITLVSDRALTIGNIVAIELERAARGLRCRRRMQIIYQFKDSTGDFVLGGAFTKPLGEAEVDALRCD